MPKRKKTKHRRRRVGAFGGKTKDIGLKVAALAGGFFLGDQINGFLNNITTKTTAATSTTPATTGIPPNNLLSIGEVGLGGLLLLRRSSGTVGMAMKVGGGILAGAGVRRVLQTMGVMKAISGYQNVPVIGRHRMAGYQNVPVIGQRNTPPQLAGKIPGQLQGYRVNGYKSSGSGVMGSIGSSDNASGSGRLYAGSGYMG
jgi:hypothetical protein